MLLLAPLVALGLSGCFSGRDSGDRGPSAPPPVAQFFGFSQETMTVPGPGQFQAFLGASRGRNATVMNLFLREGTGPARALTGGVDRNVTGLRWVSGTRLGFLRDPDGREGHRLYAVNVDGSGFRELTPAHLPDTDSTLLWPDPGRWNRWLVAIGPVHRTKDWYTIAVETGEYEWKERNPGNLYWMLWDPCGLGRLGLAFDGVHSALVHRSSDRDPFRPVATATYPEMLLPLALAPDGRAAQVASNLGRDKFVKVLMDLADGAVKKVVARDPRQDVDTAKEQERGCFRMAGRPGRAYLGPRPALPAGCWHRMLPPDPDQSLMDFTYSARDGLRIPGYLYLPPGKPDARPPAVILCHGGPEALATPGNPEARFLASRGLVVLEPNFRGSLGLGKEFLAAGFGEWGRAMQEDLADGARWLVENGWADPDRIAIMGSSYGGYAALAGATLHPEVYACAVAVSGPANLLTEVTSPLSQSMPLRTYLLIGNPEQDAERMRAVSPALHADRVRAPIFIAHGTRDSRVLFSESEQMVAALQQHGKSVEFLPLDGEGHGNWTEDSHFRLYRAIERFLGQHLGSQVGAQDGYPF